MTTPANKGRLDELEAEYTAWCERNQREFEYADSFNAWVAERQLGMTPSTRRLHQQLENRLFPKADG